MRTRPCPRTLFPTRSRLQPFLDRLQTPCYIPRRCTIKPHASSPGPECVNLYCMSRSPSQAHKATVFIAASELDSNLYYATKFIAPDPFIYLEIKGERIMV